MKPLSFTVEGQRARAKAHGWVVHPVYHGGKLLGTVSGCVGGSTQVDVETARGRVSITIGAEELLRAVATALKGGK